MLRVTSYLELTYDSKISYVSIHYGPQLELTFAPISVTLCVSTLAGDSLVVDQIYITYVVTIQECDTWDDFILRNMLVFDIILSMNLLFLYHVILNYFAKTVILAHA